MVKNIFFDIDVHKYVLVYIYIFCINPLLKLSEQIMEICELYLFIITDLIYYEFYILPKN